VLILLLILIIYWLRNRGRRTQNSRGVLEFLIVGKMTRRRWRLQRDTGLVASLESTLAEATEYIVLVNGDLQALMTRLGA
jgi:hypothetical protein